MQPSIAVIVPIRNGLPFLHEAIQCVHAQSYSPLEVVVVDDASTDGSPDAARRLGAKIIRTLAVGPAAARNAGIRATASEFIAFLDCDDLWRPGVLGRLADALIANPGAGFAQGLIQNFREREDGSRQLFTSPYRFVNLGACLYRRSLFESIGLLDESLRLGEDVDFFMRCWENDIRRIQTDDVTLLYRRHDNSMTAQARGTDLGTIQIVNRRLDRIRKGLYDPKAPRSVPAIEYIGLGPESQDWRVETPANSLLEKLKVVRREYPIWRNYRREVLDCGYFEFLAKRWSARSTWHVPFIAAQRAVRKFRSGGPGQRGSIAGGKSESPLVAE